MASAYAGAGNTGNAPLTYGPLSALSGASRVSAVSPRIRILRIQLKRAPIAPDRLRSITVRQVRLAQAVVA